MVGTGTVSENGSGTYLVGDNVSLSATASTGWRFNHWGGAPIDGVTDNVTSIIMNGNYAINAVFTKTWTLTMSIDNGTGTISPVAGVYTEDNATTVGISATGTGGCIFDHWDGSAAGQPASTSLYMTSDKSAGAFFVLSSPTNHAPSCVITAPPDNYSTTTGVSVAFVCTASDNLDPFDTFTYYWQFGDTGTSDNINPSHTYSSAGTYSVSLTVTDNGGLTGSDSITIHITTPVTPPPPPGTTYYTLTTSVTGHGTVTPPTSTYASGTSVTVTATPENGWVFDHWTGDLSGSTNPTSITMTGNKTVGAYFSQIPPENDWWIKPVQTPFGSFPLWELIVGAIVVLAIIIIIAVIAGSNRPKTSVS
jgi:hypothetical protein